MLKPIKVYDDLFKAVNGCRHRVFLEKVEDGYKCIVSEDELSEDNTYIIKSNCKSRYGVVLIGSFTNEESAIRFVEKVSCLKNQLSMMYSKQLFKDKESCNKKVEFFYSLAECMNSNIYCVVTDSNNKMSVVECELLYDDESNMYVKRNPSDVIYSSNSLNGCNIFLKKSIGGAKLNE